MDRFPSGIQLAAVLMPAAPDRGSLTLSYTLDGLLPIIGPKLTQTVSRSDLPSLTSGGLAYADIPTNSRQMSIDSAQVKR